MTIFNDAFVSYYLKQHYKIDEDSVVDDWAHMWRENFSATPENMASLDWYERQMSTILTLIQQGSKEELLKYYLDNDLEKSLSHLLDENPNLIKQTIGPSNNSLLHAATYKGLTNVIPTLVQHGCSWATKNREGKTPLMYLLHAKEELKLPLLNQFLTSYQDKPTERLNALSVQDREGYTFLHHCALMRQGALAAHIAEHIDEESYLYLLKIEDKQKAIPLSRAILNAPNLANIISFYRPTLKDSKNGSKQNLYLQSIQCGKLDMAKFFIEEGVSNKDPDYKGNIAWHLASNVATLEFLHAHNLDQIETKNKQRLKPYDWLKRQGGSPESKLLLDHFASLLGPSSHEEIKTSGASPS